MDKVQVSKIEKFKNILLVVLVLTTILLLYFLWGSESLEAFIFNDNVQYHETLDSEEVIRPNQIILSRGNEDYTVSFARKEELWNEQILGTFRHLSNDSNIFVEEITEEQYKAVMKYSSIVAKFKYNIPFMDFCEKYNVTQLQGYDNISSLTEIGFSIGSNKSTFIYDGSKKKYYRMVGERELQVFRQVDDMVEQQGITTYYALKTFLGKESTNDTLVPVEFPAAILPIDYDKDAVIGQKDIIADMAQKYFGETFDFVRKVEEPNGTTIYMYGYGKKVLIVNSSEGSIEYKEEIKSNGVEKKSMFESLDIALEFVGSHGEFKTIEGQQIKPYLESVLPIGDKGDGYKFIFSFMIGKNKLFFEEQPPIILEVVDGQVSYFKRQFLNFDENQTEKRSNEEGVSAINMLAMNYEYMRESLTKAGFIEKEEARLSSFEYIADRIDNLYTGYLKPAVDLSEEGTKSAREDQLVPVWVVEVNGIFLYFNLYDGKPRGYSKNF